MKIRVRASGPDLWGSTSSAGLNLNGVFRFRFVFVFPRFVFDPPLPQNEIETKTAHEVDKTPLRSSPAPGT
eukprot:7541971-Pyramimonas_sp.AAC.1